MKFKEVQTGAILDADYWVVFSYLFDNETPFAFVTILCGVMSIMLSGFFFFHLYMALQGTTTNERIKRSAVIETYLRKGHVLESLIEEGDNARKKADFDKLRKLRIDIGMLGNKKAL